MKDRRTNNNNTFIIVVIIQRHEGHKLKLKAFGGHKEMQRRQRDKVNL